jgi:hypothetical protein
MDDFTPQDMPGDIPDFLKALLGGMARQDPAERNRKLQGFLTEAGCSEATAARILTLSGPGVGRTAVEEAEQDTPDQGDEVTVTLTKRDLRVIRQGLGYSTIQHGNIVVENVQQAKRMGVPIDAVLPPGDDINKGLTMMVAALDKVAAALADTVEVVVPDDISSLTTE